VAGCPLSYLHGGSSKDFGLAQCPVAEPARGRRGATAGEDETIRITDRRTCAERALGLCDAPAADMTIARTERG
jgi:hypothetical protein